MKVRGDMGNFSERQAVSFYSRITDVDRLPLATG